VVGFTKNTGFMYAQQGIRCNAIAPGGVETNISASMTGVNTFGMGRIQPGLGINPRVGKPEDIAKVALFLASEESSFVNERYSRLMLVGLHINKNDRKTTKDIFGSFSI
jgi:NAD(P)-dependent dehydrogenase (short-subunit alcohol dehydrogenase family)